MENAHFLFLHFFFWKKKNTHKKNKRTMMVLYRSPEQTLMTFLSSYLRNIHLLPEHIVSTFSSNFLKTNFIPTFGNTHKKPMNCRPQCTSGPISPTRKVLLSISEREKNRTGPSSAVGTARQYFDLFRLQKLCYSWIFVGWSIAM